MSARNLEPKAVWNHFEDLNLVPRGSKKEERVIAFAVDFGKSLGLQTKVDKTGNVVIKKPASAGMEDRPIVVLQSHLDMVHQKNGDTKFDFDNDPIESYIDGEWLTAKGTTLGADNGMGVASIMALLSSTDIAHPPLEAMFTVDEETGMTGAFGLEPHMFDGRILLNLDTEDDDELSIGCAGGIDVNAQWDYTQIEPTHGMEAIKLVLKGLKGGHSGMEINIGRVNANKLMGRTLRSLSMDFNLASFDGGSLRNAIPREASVILLVAPDKVSQLKKELIDLEKVYLAEYGIKEPSLNLTTTSINFAGLAMDEDSQLRLITALCAVFNGVFRMSDSIEGLVETSCSLARVLVQDGHGMVQALARSSVESGKMDVAKTVAGTFELIGAKAELTGSYPGWQPNPSSKLLTLMKDKYTAMFPTEELHVKACHAGLECGIIGEHFEGEMDMISFGPTIRNPHSPDEKVNIKSVQKFWSYLLEVLKEIK